MKHLEYSLVIVIDCLLSHQKHVSAATMADPLSLVASIVTLTEAAKSVITYCISVKGGAEDRLRLRKELRDVLGLFLVLQEDMREQHEGDSIIMDLLTQPGGPLATINTCLDQLASKVSSSKGVRRVVQNVV